MQDDTAEIKPMETRPERQKHPLSLTDHWQHGNLEDLAFDGMWTVHLQHPCPEAGAKARVSYLGETLCGSLAGRYLASPPDFNAPWVKRSNRSKGVTRTSTICPPYTLSGLTGIIRLQRKSKYSLISHTCSYSEAWLCDRG